jgi:hypothetical protein
MKNYPIIIISIILGLLFSVTSLPAVTLENLSVHAGYAFGSQKDTLVNSVNGPGFEVRLDWRISERWSFRLNSGHWYLSIDQDNAHRVMDWPYWKQIYGYVVYLAENNPVFDVNVNPKQDLKIKPVEAGLLWTSNKTARFQVCLSLLGGATFYRRQLYIEEYWTKHFPSIDYSFSYDFQNRSDAKNGRVWNVSPGVCLNWRVSDYILLSGEGLYRYYLNNRKDADFFPLKNHLQIKAGIHFIY